VAHGGVGHVQELRRAVHRQREGRDQADPGDSLIKLPFFVDKLERSSLKSFQDKDTLRIGSRPNSQLLD
jgi:hypothetical protein